VSLQPLPPAANPQPSTRKLESEYSQLDTLEGRQGELEALHKAEGRRRVEAGRDVKDLEKALYAQSQQLFCERAKEKDLISAISGGQAQNRNMVAKIQQLDDQARRREGWLGAMSESHSEGTTRTPTSPRVPVASTCCGGQPAWC